MITTVVTSTVTSVTTVSDFGIILGLVTIIALVTLLCVKELATASNSGQHRPLARFLDVGVIPLAIIFVMIVAMEVVKILA